MRDSGTVDDDSGAGDARSPGDGGGTLHDAGTDSFVPGANCIPRCMAKVAACGSEAPSLEALCVGTCVLRPDEATIRCIEDASCAALAEGACAPEETEDAGPPDAGAAADAGVAADAAPADAGPECLEADCASLSTRRTCYVLAGVPIVRHYHCEGFLCADGECTETMPPDEVMMSVRFVRMEPVPHGNRGARDIRLEGQYSFDRELPAPLIFDDFVFVSSPEDDDCRSYQSPSLRITETEFSITLRGGAESCLDDINRNGVTLTMDATYASHFDTEVVVTAEILPVP